MLKQGRGAVIELALRQGIRGQSQDQDRSVGGIEFIIGRVAFERTRQIGARRVDRGLNIARRAIDVPVETELQRNVRRADAALRGHLGHVGNLAEMSFERRRHRCRHRIRACTRHLRLHSDRRKVDRRQRRDREQAKSEQARNADGDRHQDRCDRAPDKDRTDVHGAGVSGSRALPPRSRSHFARRSSAR